MGIKVYLVDQHHVLAKKHISSCVIIAKCSEANYRDLWASESQLVFIFIAERLSVRQVILQHSYLMDDVSHVFGMQLK